MQQRLRIESPAGGNPALHHSCTIPAYPGIELITYLELAIKRKIEFNRAWNKPDLTGVAVMLTHTTSPHDTASR